MQVFVDKLKLVVSVCHALKLIQSGQEVPSWRSPTLLSELLAPDPPLCPEAIYHRLLSCELRQQSRLVLLEQLELQAETPILLHLCFQGMQTALAEGEGREMVLMINGHLSQLTDGKAAGPFSIHDISRPSPTGSG